MAGTRITNHPVTSNLVPHGPRRSTGRSPSGMGNSTFWRLKSLQFIISAISDIHHPNRSGKNKHVKPTMMRMSLFISSLFTAKRCTSSTHDVRPRCRTSSPRASLQRHQVPWQHTSPRCCTPRRPPWATWVIGVEPFSHPWPQWASWIELMVTYAVSGGLKIPNTSKHNINQSLGGLVVPSRPLFGVAWSKLGYPPRVPEAAVSVDSSACCASRLGSYTHIGGWSSIIINP
jgi:hypothetical protein